jgi:hypothetical protein
MIVLFREDNLPPMSWKLAIISAAFPGGSDGHVIVATVKSSTGLFKQSIYVLVALPVK